MLRLAVVGFLPALLLHAQSPCELAECLDALARTAATFAATAPGLMAEETLDQRGRHGFYEALKKKKFKDLDLKLPPDFRTHHVISSYALAEIGEAHALHEVRTIVSMDGRSLTTAADAGRALTTRLQSNDDRIRRQLLEDLQHDQLEGAVTDFGPLILLFTERSRKDYTFDIVGEQHLGQEPVVILGYRQISGEHGLTVFNERTEERQPASGQIWLRQKDLLPIRITMNTEEPLTKKLTIRTMALVDYMPSPFGLVPTSVIHMQFLSVGLTSHSLMVENDFHYSDFHKIRAMIP
jgi:hypothetical protein